MKKVLVIEDEVMICELVKIILDSEGYSVQCINDASHYETDLRDSHADLVLLDLNIGKINGQDICDYIKGQSDLKHIPTILMSANYNIKQVKEECGAEDYIKKPFDVHTLIATVNHYALAW